MASKANRTPANADPLLRRAAKKLGPGDWHVTSRSLQQATPWQVAQQKASWFGNELVFDLCCGLGGDAIALAKRGAVIAVDSDAQLTKLTELNLNQIKGPKDWEVWTSDVTTALIPMGASIHIDPDRRISDSRTTQPDHCQPGWSDVCRIVSTSAAAIVKLAPAADVNIDQLPPSHRCWISLQGRVREQSILCGQTMDRAGVKPGSRSALSLAGDGSASWYRPKTDAPEIDTASEPQKFLIDPDAAIRAAELTESFAADHGLSLLHLPSGFLTVQQLDPSVSTMAITGEVIWSGVCDDRKLRRQFRTMNVFPQTIKVRGTDHDPNVLTKRYRKCGESPITLWIGRAGKRVFAAMTTGR